MKRLELTHLSKIFWPEEGYTKGDVIDYYDQISAYILPYLKDRPESLNRHPDGIEGENFFQKDLKEAPSWVKTLPIHSDSENKDIHWLICNDKETLLYMANLGCIEINPWNSKIKKKNYPDYLILDLDPVQVTFREVIKTAIEIKKVFDDLKLPAFLKTSGKKGLHILSPLGAKYTFEETRQFAEILANLIHEKVPQTTSVVRDPQKRKKRVYIDFLQNRIGQTISCPYSLRPVEKAPVSTPLSWSELDLDLLPTNFTIKNIFDRVQKKGDVWKGFLAHKGIDMKESLDLLGKLFKL